MLLEGSQNKVVPKQHILCGFKAADMTFKNGHRCSFGTLFRAALNVTQRVRTRTRTF